MSSFRDCGPSFTASSKEICDSAVADQTIHVDAMVLAAFSAEARQTGQTLETVAREHLGFPQGRLVLVAVDMTAALERRLLVQEAGESVPLPQMLQTALGDATRQPSKG